MEFAESKQSSDQGATQRRQNFALRCSSQAMQLIRERLDLDIVELWKYDGNQYECLFIHAADTVVQEMDDVISSNNYFPNSGSAEKHKYSPLVRAVFLSKYGLYMLALFQVRLRFVIECANQELATIGTQ